MFASSARPSVATPMALSRYGVSAAPVTPSRSAARLARATSLSISSRSSDSLAAIGTASTIPAPRATCSRAIRAAPSASFTRCARCRPLERTLPDAPDGPPVVERDRRGDRPEGADLRLEQLCGPQAPRSGKAVRDDRGLECNDGALAGDRVGDLWRDGELHESWGVRGGRSPP